MRANSIVHVDLDAFFAAVEQRDNPSLKGKPVVVGADPRGGRGRGVVSTCSYEARPYGIRSAMPISQAYRLCPHAVFVRPNFSKYRQASDEIFRIFHDFTPHVQPISIDEAFLDLTESCHLFGTPAQACRLLKDRIFQRVKLTASVGIAPVKFVAKIASDVCKPDGLLEVKPGQITAFLEPLPIERLWGVGPKTKTFLNAMGVKTIGDVRRQDLSFLEKRLGEHGVHLWNLANGIDPRVVEVDEEIKSISHEHTFDEDTGDVEDIRKIILWISEKLSRRLRKAGLKGKTITVKIRLKGFKTFTRALTLPQRTNFTDVIYHHADELFKAFPRGGQKVRLIGVRVSNYEDPYVQDSLFEERNEKRLEDVHRVIDRIKDKFGEGAIHRAG